MSHQSYLILIVTGLIVLLLGKIPNCICQIDDATVYEICSRPFSCGNITEIGYPFWDGDRPPFCNLQPGFQLNCRDNDTLHLNISSLSHRVLRIDNTTQTLRIARDDLFYDLCEPLQFNTTLNLNLFRFSPAADEQNITLYYSCSFPISPDPDLSPFGCSNSLFTTTPAALLGSGVVLSSCETIITVRANRTALDLMNPTATTSVRARLLEEALDSGFLIRWYADNFPCGDSCDRSVGFCGLNLTLGPESYACY